MFAAEEFPGLVDAVVAAVDSEDGLGGGLVDV